MTYREATRICAILVVGLLTLAGCAHEGHDGASESTSPEAHSSGHSSPPSATNAGLVTRSGERMVTVAVPADYAPKAPSGATDEYRCFVVDPELSEDVMITGTQFLPGNPAIVHHSILFAANSAQAPAAEQLDAADPEPGYECFGGAMLPARGGVLAGLDESDWITAWAPGGSAGTMPKGYGMELQQDGLIIIQMHYNLRSEQGIDNTAVQLRVTEKDLKPMRTMLLPAPVELACAPGESGRLCDRTDAVDDVVSRFGADSGATIAGLQLLCGGDPDDPRESSVQTCDRPVSKPAKVFAVAGHMHLLGREISVTLNPGQPDEKVLLDITNWDFDQQGAVPLDAPVRIGPGDTLRVRCRHDATLRSQLPALQGTPARYVVWGEGTTDEMCLAILLNG